MCAKFKGWGAILLQDTMQLGHGLLVAARVAEPQIYACTEPLPFEVMLNSQRGKQVSKSIPQVAMTTAYTRATQYY